MKKNVFIIIILTACLFFVLPVTAGASENTIKTETIDTGNGPLKIFFIGHGTLKFSFNGKTIHVDPFSKLTDYSAQPKADLILITHHHGDHLDKTAIAAIHTEKTKTIIPDKCKVKLPHATIMNNGEKNEIMGITVEAVPAYNIQHKRKDGNPFHPKGEGNGYILTFGEKRIYVAGDTEVTPEMKQLKNIDVAFLPMNLPYTMTPEMVVDAVKAFKPRVLYPYHYLFGTTDLPKLEELMKNVKSVKLKIIYRK